MTNIKNPNPDGQEREALNAAWNRCVEGRVRPFPSGDAGFWFHAGFEACYEAALAAREEPQKGAIVDELIGAGREDAERPDHITTELDDQGRPTRMVVAAREDTEPKSKLDQSRAERRAVWHPEDTERPTIRQHEELQRAYEEALGRANRAEKSLREDAERPDERLRGALNAVCRAYHDMAHTPSRSYDHCIEVMCANVRQLLRDTEQGPKR